MARFNKSSDAVGKDREIEDGVTIQVPTNYLSPSFNETDFNMEGYELLPQKDYDLKIPRGNSFSSMSQNQVKIKYQDFFPEFYNTSKDIRNETWMRTSDFKMLLESANKWLSENPGIELKSCESVIWSSDDVRDLITPSDLMVTSICLEEDRPTFFILGLRLWYLASTSAKVRAITILEFIPMATDSTIQDLVRQIDTDIRSDDILNLETLSLPLLSGYLDSNLTSWKENMDYTTTHAYFLRLYLMKDKVTSDKISPVISHLSIEDFVPRLNDDGTYEGFSELLQRCNDWNGTNDVTIVNLQSIFAKEDSVQHEDTGKSCFFEKPGINHPGSIDYFRILRVVYMTGVSWPFVDNLENNVFRKSGSETLPIFYEMFTPELLKAPPIGEGGGMAKRLSVPRGPTIEGMSMTFAKMADFVSEGDLEVVSVEMVSNPVQFRFDESKNGLKFLFSIRLFYRTRNYRRESKIIGASPKKVQVNARQTRPGPIFLKNVVSQKFPYRWLMLSLSAFASMTIIVVISIIYSHKLE